MSFDFLLIEDLLIYKTFLSYYLGHETYKVDTDVYKNIIATFGEDIINPVDRSIDRKILGKKVFESSNELKRLTDIVWPGIFNLTLERIDYLFKEGKKFFKFWIFFCQYNYDLIRLGKRIIILDAAVLIEAKWTAAVNEIWVATIPPKEVMLSFILHLDIRSSRDSFFFLPGYPTYC